MKKGGRPSWLPPESQSECCVLPRQTYLTHCATLLAVTDSLARGCSWNHGRNTAKCIYYTLHYTRARRAFSCRTGRSVVVPHCCRLLLLLRLTLHSSILYSSTPSAAAAVYGVRPLRRKCRAGSAARHRGPRQRTMGTKKGGTRRKSSCSPPHENNIVIG